MELTDTTDGLMYIRALIKTLETYEHDYGNLVVRS